MSSRPGTPSRRSRAVPTPKRTTSTTPKRASKTTPLDSLHPILPRQPSFPSLQANKSTSSLSLSPSKASGRISPLKPKPPSSHTVTQHALTSALPKGHRTAPRSSEDPETSFSHAGSDSDDSGDEGRAIPVRRPGFGQRKAQDTEDEGGFATAKEGSASSGFSYEVDDEEEEDAVDGKQENVVVCLRCVCGGYEGGTGELTGVVRRVRPTRRTASSVPSIYAYQQEQGQLSLDPSHPTFLRRGAMAKTTTSPRDEYEFRFGEYAPSSCGREADPRDRRSPPLACTD